jgi:hypothetical protein
MEIIKQYQIINYMKIKFLVNNKYSLMKIIMEIKKFTKIKKA